MTYRRGTGLVSGGAGTQGTYTALDPEGSGVTGNESLQSRSPGLSTKVGRRAAMHITGPTLVTVPLHITSNLALGVLQGGGGNRVIHRGRDKDGGDRVEGKEGGEKVESKESRAMERKVEEGRKVQEEEKNCSGKVTDREGVEDAEGKAGVGGGGEEEGEVKKEEDKEEEEVREERTWKPEVVMGGQDAEEDNDEDAVDDDKDVDYDYIGNFTYFITMISFFFTTGVQPIVICNICYFINNYSNDSHPWGPGQICGVTGKKKHWLHTCMFIYSDFSPLLFFL